MDLHDTVRVVGWGAYYYLHKPLDPWPIVERLVENAVRFGRNEQAVQKNRTREIDIARLLRTYIITSSVQAEASDSDRLAHQIRIEVAARPIDRNEPSGDFAEWFNRNPSEVCFYVADASGHGDLLPSFLSCLSNMVLHRSHHGGRPSPDEVVSRIDAALVSLRSQGGLESSRHLTFFLGLLNLEHGELHYVNAGHPAAFLVCRSREGREDAVCRRLEPTSKPVGFFFGDRPEVQRVRPGEVLFLYTDGANELLQGEDRLEKGFVRLEEILRPLISGTVQEIVDGVAGELTRQAGPGGFQDDTTLMAIKIYGAEG
jgi:serine phosphatase RsbU (regulator of sigma subunit)